MIVQNIPNQWPPVYTGDCNIKYAVYKFLPVYKCLAVVQKIYQVIRIQF